MKPGSRKDKLEFSGHRKKADRMGRIQNQQDEFMKRDESENNRLIKRSHPQPRIIRN